MALNLFDYFQNSVTVKSRGVSFCWFRRLLLRGTFNFSRKVLRKSQQRIVGDWKIYEFLKKVADFRLSRCLPIEGTFYRRTNLTFSIRYISEKCLQDVKIITSCQDGTKRKMKWYGSNWLIPKRKNDGQMPLYPCGQNVHAVLLHT